MEIGRLFRVGGSDLGAEVLERLDVVALFDQFEVLLLLQLERHLRRLCIVKLEVLDDCRDLVPPPLQNAPLEILDVLRLELEAGLGLELRR